MFQLVVFSVAFLWSAPNMADFGAGRQVETLDRAQDSDGDWSLDCLNPGHRNCGNYVGNGVVNHV